jgi:hypothetical protein
VVRYFAIATVIVMSIAILVTAWNNRDLIRIRIAPTTVPAPPKPGDDADSPGRSESPLTGDAPWALSALPDCATQERTAHGRIAFVRSKLPSDAQAIAPGTAFTLGACTIFVGNGEIHIHRGSDRLRIPPVSTLYRTSEGFALLRQSGKTADLRVYERPTYQP